MSYGAHGSSTRATFHQWSQADEPLRAALRAAAQGRPHSFSKAYAPSGRAYSSCPEGQHHDSTLGNGTGIVPSGQDAVTLTQAG